MPQGCETHNYPDLIICAIYIRKGQCMISFLLFLQTAWSRLLSKLDISLGHFLAGAQGIHYFTSPQACASQLSCWAVDSDQFTNPSYIIVLYCIVQPLGSFLLMHSKCLYKCVCLFFFFFFFLCIFSASFCIFSLQSILHLFCTSD